MSDTKVIQKTKVMGGTRYLLEYVVKDAKTGKERKARVVHIVKDEDKTKKIVEMHALKGYKVIQITRCRCPHKDGQRFLYEEIKALQGKKKREVRYAVECNKCFSPTGTLVKRVMRKVEKKVPRKAMVKRSLPKALKMAVKKDVEKKTVIKRSRNIDPVASKAQESEAIRSFFGSTKRMGSSTMATIASTLL